ncbi:hypothetical protein HZC33_00785 [Candidatus Wolfebacteria bacterium]|nr:hypothetical protein [Candidatus Wolfebacteria bacterium]
MTIGLIFLIFGYSSALGSVIIKKSSNLFLKKEWDFNKVPWVFAVIFGFSLIIKTIRILGGGYSYLARNPLFEKSYLYSLVGALDWFSYIALIIAFSSYFYLFKNNDNRYKIWRVVAWGIFMFEMIYAIPSCSRVLAFTPILLYLIVRWYVLEKNYLKLSLILFFSIIIFFPLGTICRFPAYNSNNSSLNSQVGKAIQSVIEKGEISGQKVADNKFNVISAASNIGKFVADNFLVRANQVVIISSIIQHPQPFLYGATLREFLFTFGPPRFLWKNKPLSINASGNEFGRRIGVLGDGDTTTSVGPTILGDWYLNFGLMGIIFGMFFMGILFRLIYEYLINGPEVSLSGIMIYSVLWIQIIKGMEDWIAPVYVGIIRTLIILLFVNFLLVKKETID